MSVSVNARLSMWMFVLLFRFGWMSVSKRERVRGIGHMNASPRLCKTKKGNINKEEIIFLFLITSFNQQLERTNWVSETVTPFSILSKG